MNGYLARIAELENQVDLLQNEVFELRKGKDSQKIISELMSQIATLKEIAVEERAKRIYKGRFRSLNFELPVDRNTHIVEARRQLTKEHPEAFR